MNRIKKTLLATAITTLMMSSTQAVERDPAPKDKLAAQQQLRSLSTDRLIVKFRAPATTAGAFTDRQTTLNRAAGSLGLEAKTIRRMAIGADVVQLSRKADPVEVATLLRQLQAEPGVEYAQVDRMLRPMYTPNDPGFVDQWHYQGGPGGLNLQPAWDISQGAGIVVAVIDTGIVAHTDLNANVLQGYDFISTAEVGNDGNGRDTDASDPGDWVEENECDEEGSDAEDSSWHGTHVAGTIAAVTNNGSGVAGAAPLAKIVPVRALGKCGGFTSDIADAIVWSSGGNVVGVPANANPAEVINLSLGGGGSCDPATQIAINGAVGRGSTVVVAAGNSNSSANDFSPASCDNVISVASNDIDFVRSSFSNAGDKIDVAGPGGDTGILSTLNTGTTVPAAQGYAFYQGTSMASPHVAAVVALMQAEQVNTPARVEEILKLTSKFMPGASCPGLCGAGKVDATAALAGVAGVFPTPKKTVLRNGVGSPVTAGGAGSEQRYVLSTYNGLRNAIFRLSGGTGNADLYVRFNSPPTTSTYDCRSNGPTTTEECVFDVGQVGVYHVLVRGVTNHSGAKVSGKYLSRTFTNKDDKAIRDLGGWGQIPVLVHGRPGNASATTSVTVNIHHTYVGDLILELAAPDGTIYPLQANLGGSGDLIAETFTVDLSSELANGQWLLRVRDDGPADVGHVDQWTMKF